jgi:hypothetical protein
LGRVFRDFDETRFAFRQQSAHGSPFLIVEFDFQWVPSAVAALPTVGDIELIAQRNLSEPANLLPFRVSVGSLRHMRPSTVPISGGRASSPALESMVEGGRTFVSEQPRDLPERHPGILQILSREALPQFVDDVAVCRACPTSAPLRQREVFK